jgi:hypothetical protein
MAPERKRHSDRKSRKTSTNRQVATINIYPANSPNALPGSNSLVGDHRLSIDINTPESVPHSGTSNDGVQTNEQEVYLCIDRPWEQKINRDYQNDASTSTVPVDRWQTESMLDGPWHGIAGAYALQKQNSLSENNNNWMDSGEKGNGESQTEEAGSMACAAPSSKK